MPLNLNSILSDAGFALADVRLLRHKDQQAAKGKTPYVLWRDHREQFESYQATQAIKNRSRLAAPFWASFVGTPDDDTLFVGIYAVEYQGLIQEDRPMPHCDGIDKAGTCDEYRLSLDERLVDLEGRLFIEWGKGKRSWIQRADSRNKPIIELRREFKEDEFPGFLNFIESLSKLERLPAGWVAALKSARGVYLLTCPKTKEQYVGKADGKDGFWGRWQDYVQTGHGGILGLKSRDPSDYQVSILEVAGSASTVEAIYTMERRWMAKLQSREMGLNRN